MTMNNFLLFLSSIVLMTACSSDDPTITTPEIISQPTPDPVVSDKPNIMLIIADDMGLDATPGYTIGTTKPNMPNLQNMISTGITFNNVWANPTCSPTRASIITGKYGFRTGVTKVGIELPTSETSLQQYLDTETASVYSNAVIGKWHLSSTKTHPNTMGVDYFAGFMRGGLSDYSNWELTTNGIDSNVTTYATSKITDLAIDWIKDQTKPWFLWLAYNAPHTPFHLPPTNLHTQGALPTDNASINANPLPYYMAMIEAMDTELGRLLNTMSAAQKENTIFIFIGDNGTPRKVGQGYTNGTKDTVYEGGVNVPMVIAGKNISRKNVTEDALINTTDLFATIANLAGSTTTEINDSKSFKDLLTDSNANTRSFTYTEVGRDGTTSDYTIRNTSHKYIKFADDKEALFHLINDPLEQTNLLDQLILSTADAEAKDVLLAELARIKK